MAVRTEPQIAADFGGWASDGQQCRFGCSRGGRRAGDRVYSRSSGRAVPALGAADPHTGGLVALVRGTVPLLSRAPAGPGHVARPHRHDPHRPRPGADQAFTPEPFYQGLSLPNARLLRALTNPNSCPVVGLQHFIDPGISE